MKKSAIVLFCSAALCLVWTRAHAVCDQTSASTADVDLWNTHGCWGDFFRWSYKAYDQRESDWKDRGWYDACNVNLEFPKHWNAAYLVTYGLLDDKSSWHGTVDYRAVGEAAASNFHKSLYHTCRDDTCCYGSFRTPLFGPDELSTHCAVYNAAVTNANPASRAGEFIHEGWHAWELKYGWAVDSCGGHTCGPIGACTQNGCDHFYFHDVDAYGFGLLWLAADTERHSPNQVQVEFLCDVADYSQSWVPASVRQAARADADARAVERFINGPGYKCGDPRPWPR